MSRAQRSPRVKGVILVALCVVLMGGLLVCGPAHDALHSLVSDAPHADADGCSLLSLAAPAHVCLIGPALRPLSISSLHPARVPAAPPLLAHSPRGPPAPSS